MIESHLRHHLEPVAQRHRQLRLSLGLIVAWLGIAVVAGILLLLQRFAGWSTPFTIGALIVLGAVAVPVILIRQPLQERQFLRLAVVDALPAFNGWISASDWAIGIALPLSTIRRAPGATRGAAFFVRHWVTVRIGPSRCCPVF